MSQPNCASVRDGSNTFTAMYGDAALKKIDGHCDCFLFQLHDPTDCRLGATMYLSQFGAFDPLLFLQIICCVLACWVCWQVHRGKHSSSASRSIIADPFASTSGTGSSKVRAIWYSRLFLILLFFTSSISWVGRLYFNFDSAGVARKKNIVYSAVFNYGCFLLVMMLQAAWFHMHSSWKSLDELAQDDNSARARAGASAAYEVGQGQEQEQGKGLAQSQSALSTLLSQFWGYLAENYHSTGDCGGGGGAVLSLPLTRFVATLAPQWWTRSVADGRTAFAHIVRAVVWILLSITAIYPIFAIIFGKSLKTDWAYEGDKVGLPRLSKNNTSIFPNYLWALATAWVICLLVCIDFLLAVIAQHYWGIAGRNPGRQKSEQARDQTRCVTVATIMLAFVGMFFNGVIHFNFCPYVDWHDDPRGDPHEQPFMELCQFVMFLSITVLFMFEIVSPRETNSVMFASPEVPQVRLYAEYVSRTFSFLLSCLLVIQYVTASRYDTPDERLLYLLAFLMSLWMTTDLYNAHLLVLPWITSIDGDSTDTSVDAINEEHNCDPKSPSSYITKLITNIRHCFRKYSTGSLIATFANIGILLFWFVSVIWSASLKTFARRNTSSLMIVPALFLAITKVGKIFFRPLVIQSVNTPRFRSALSYRFSASPIADAGSGTGSGAGWGRANSTNMKRSTERRQHTPSEGEANELGRRKRDSPQFLASDTLQWNLLDMIATLCELAIYMYIVYMFLLMSFALLIVYALLVYLVFLLVRNYFHEAAVTAKAAKAAGAGAVGGRGGDVELTDTVQGGNSGYNATATTEAEAEIRCARSDTDSVVDSGDLHSDPQRLLQHRWVSAKQTLIMLLSMVLTGMFFLLFTHVIYFSGDPLPYNKKQLMIIGHRGLWMAGIPENSFESVDKAKHLYGFHGVEWDVRLTKDNVLVVMHDAKLDRTTTGKGNVYDKTLAELKELTLKAEDGTISNYCPVYRQDTSVPCTASGETVHTLKEMLEYVYRAGIIAEVEIKQVGNPDKATSTVALDIIPRAVDEICLANMEKSAFIATCEFRFQNVLNEIAPSMTLEKDYLYHTNPNSLVVPRDANILGISGLFLLFNPWIIPNAHRAGQGVMVYFVLIENSWIMQMYMKMGVDFFMINDGNVCLEAGICKPKLPYFLEKTM